MASSISNTVKVLWILLCVLVCLKDLLFSFQTYLIEYSNSKDNGKGSYQPENILGHV